jgi:hypothetical protein
MNVLDRFFESVLHNPRRQEKIIKKSHFMEKAGFLIAKLFAEIFFTIDVTSTKN